jgi:hypothetical protein
VGKPPVVKGGLGWACNSQSDCIKGSFLRRSRQPRGLLRQCRLRQPRRLRGGHRRPDVLRDVRRDPVLL